MNSRLAAATVLLAAAHPATAHRLDEYLQATTISVERGHVRARMRLTPGIAVFDRVMALLDADRNGLVTPSERKAYAERILRDLSLVVDGVRLPLHLVSRVFPSVEAMKKGLGELDLELDATPPHGRGGHRLVFENRHQSRIGAYLVNGLVPEDPGIAVTGQRRNADQSHYEMDYVQDDPPTSGTTAWLFGGVALSTILALRSRYDRAKRNPDRN